MGEVDTYGCAHFGGYVDSSDRAVVKRGPQRRRHSVEQKRRIVEETLQPGTSVARVARAHEVNANQVFAWRRQYREGLLGTTSEALGLLPVRVIEAARATVRSRSTTAYRTTPGMIQIEPPKGQLRLTGCVDAEALRVVLEKLLG